MSVSAAVRPTTGLDGQIAGPGPREVWRAARAPVAGALVLIVLGILTAIAQNAGHRGELDPAAVDPAGSRALATLLTDRGVAVRRARTVAEARAAADGASTVFVPLPDRLPAESLRALAARGGAALVLVDPDPATLAALAPGVRRSASVPVGSRRPACSLTAAVAAGSVEIGGTSYEVSDPAAAQCYASGGAPTLVALTGPAGPVAVLGSAQLFTNDRLARDGNAALALGLLGGRSTLLWLLPAPGQPPPSSAKGTGLVDLLPTRLLLALGEVALAGVAFALWRARGLGPVVAEPLPVVVRSVETVEGRARLYRAAGARTAAADALRAGARSRLGELLARRPEVSPEALLDAVSARTARPAAAVGALLYGADGDQPDDAALVRLAGELDALEREVRRP